MNSKNVNPQPCRILKSEHLPNCAKCNPNIHIQCMISRQQQSSPEHVRLNQEYEASIVLPGHLLSKQKNTRKAELSMQGISSSFLHSCFARRKKQERQEIKDKKECLSVGSLVRVLRWGVRLFVLAPSLPHSLLHSFPPS